MFDVGIYNPHFFGIISLFWLFFNSNIEQFRAKWILYSKNVPDFKILYKKQKPPTFS